jgi:hypothetical protein
MSANEFLCQIVGVNPQKFSKEENILLEAELFTRVCEKMEKFFKDKYKNFLRLIKLDPNKDSGMREDNLVYCIVNDIISIKAYTLKGIAYYIKIPEDVIYQASLATNKPPSATLLRRLIELHRSVRPDRYFEIIEEITMDHLAIKNKSMN